MPTVSLSPIFNGWQGFSPAGLPLTLGQVYTYQAGTNTPLNTYTTNSGVTPNSNPIQLDAGGRPPQEIWLDNASAYKFVLQDALGITLGTYDNISGVNALATTLDAALRADLANTASAVKGASLSGFNFTLNYATDTIGWSVKQQGVLVDLLGAKGDGITDCSAAVLQATTLSPSGTVRFGSGTYIVGQIVLPVGCSLQGSGLSSTVIKLKDNANPTGGVLDTPNFAALTGTTSLGGWFNNQISDLTIDGNKANNATGYGLRIYGKSFRLQNVRVQNCAQVGIYTEYQGGDDFTTPTKNLEATISNVSVLLCGGDGIHTYKGPHDMIVNNVVIYSCGGWGWNNETPINGHHVNTFLCTSGGLWGHNGGTFAGSNWIGSTATGWGALLETGGNNITAGSFGGPIALEIRANNNRISGVVANSTTAGVKLNGASAQARLDLVMFNNTGFHFDVAGASLKSIVNAFVGDALGVLQNAAFPGDWQIVGYSGFTGALNQLDGTNCFGGGRVCLPNTSFMSQTTRGIFYDTSAPVSGSFNRGDRVFNSNPSVGSPKAWACTASGTPGTWVSEGNL